MTGLSRRAIEVVESFLPRVRRRRNAYARIDEHIDEQRATDPTVPIGAFRCERCERVQSRFAVGGLAQATTAGQPDARAGDETRAERGGQSDERVSPEVDARTEVWCLECIEHRAEAFSRLDRTPGHGPAGRN